MAPRPHWPLPCRESCRRLQAGYASQTFLNSWFKYQYLYNMPLWWRPHRPLPYREPPPPPSWVYKYTTQPLSKCLVQISQVYNAGERRQSSRHPVYARARGDVFLHKSAQISSRGHLRGGEGAVPGNEMMLMISPIWGTLSVIQGTFGAIQGTFGVIQIMMMIHSFGELGL